MRIYSLGKVLSYKSELKVVPIDLNRDAPQNWKWTLNSKNWLLNDNTGSPQPFGRDARTGKYGPGNRTPSQFKFVQPCFESFQAEMADLDTSVVDLCARCGDTISSGKCQVPHPAHLCTEIESELEWRSVSQSDTVYSRNRL